jgi:hypothetical protein
MMTGRDLTYDYPPPRDWRKHLIPDGIQFRVKTSDGSLSGSALVIAHADLIREMFGEGDPLEVARENSDEILRRAKELIERPDNRQLDLVCHLYDPKSANGASSATSGTIAAVTLAQKAVGRPID